ncbi:unnamed protein product [Linum trigynum]|uniref:Uncharacterized protein n=1 Tax=Linum trigynum TaxID=586398 RepID=A0AAV2DJ55_9ROSI
MDQWEDGLGLSFCLHMSSLKRWVDFGILVRSGFSVSKALFFNFLSALLALDGTALALLWGKDPGQSSLIEGFTAGGFIYISAAGVLAEMNNGRTSLKSTVVHTVSLIVQPNPQTRRDHSAGLASLKTMFEETVSEKSAVEYFMTKS